MNGSMLMGAIAVSVVALAGWTVVSVLVFTTPMPNELRLQLVPVVVTGWMGLAGTAVGFWVGSSVGAHREERMKEIEK